jgi:hypothetical protein
MKIIQKYPDDYLGKLTIEIHDDNLAFHYKTLINETSWENKYTEIDPNFRKCIHGVTEWGNIGAVFFWIALLLGWVSFLVRLLTHYRAIAQISGLLMLPCLVIASILYILRFFIKNTWVQIFSTKGAHLASLKETKELDDFLSELRKKIEKNK